MNSLQVVGIDPSLTCTGFATVGEGGVLAALRFPSEAGDNGLGDVRKRVRYIVGSILRFAPTKCITVIEAPMIPRHGSGQVLERAWLFGMLVDQLWARGPVVQVRAKTRAKYGAESGNADKKAVLAAVRSAYPSVRVRDDNGVVTEIDDQLDTLAVNLLRFREMESEGKKAKEGVWSQMLERAEGCDPFSQESALARVTWSPGVESVSEVPDVEAAKVADPALFAEVEALSKRWNAHQAKFMKSVVSPGKNTLTVTAVKPRERRSNEYSCSDAADWQ